MIAHHHDCGYQYRDLHFILAIIKTTTNLRVMAFYNSFSIFIALRSLATLFLQCRRGCSIGHSSTKTPYHVPSACLLAYIGISWHLRLLRYQDQSESVGSYSILFVVVSNVFLNTFLSNTRLLH